jgi:hypothetical protein
MRKGTVGLDIVSKDIVSKDIENKDIESKDIVRKDIVSKGFKLLLISITFRFMSYLLFCFSWQWSGVFARGIEIVIGILFISTWFLYGLRKKAGFLKGLLIGLIGTSDAILLMIFSFVLYISRDSYYFGPIEMMVWNIPLLGILNQLNAIVSNIVIYGAPFLAIILAAIGNFLGKYKEKDIISY